jgi:hypothetical protein
LRVALAAVRSLQPVLPGRGLGHGTRAKERVLTIVRVVVVGSRATLLVVNEKSPWLNPMKPKWIHGKRKVVEPHGLLEIEERGALLRCHGIEVRADRFKI